MRIEVLFFGRAKELVGSRSLPFEVSENATVMTLRTLLCKRYEGLDEGLQYAVAINEVYAENHQVIRPGDVVAILPPVSGG